MPLLSRTVNRIARLGLLCLTSGFCFLALQSILFPKEYHLSSLDWHTDVKDQVRLKSLLLSNEKCGNVDSASLKDKKLWLLMTRKDCRCLGQLAEKHNTVRMSKEEAQKFFPLLACPKIENVKNLIEESLTFALLKPDIISRGLTTDVLRRLEEKGLHVVALAKHQFSREEAKLFYSEHAQRPFFPELISYMTSGPSLALILVGRDGVKRWRGLMGPTDPAAARRDAPRSLRAVYGLDMTKNGCHGSDSPESAIREIIFACTRINMVQH